MDHIKRNINPAELNIRIDGTRKTKNGVAVYCDNASDVNKLENALKTKLGSTYQIHQPKKFNPRMIISNVTLGDELNNDEAITSDIIGLNDLKEIESSQIKIITKLKTRNNDHHIVIEVPPDVRNQFVRTGHVYLSWGRYVVADHLNVIQCRRCFSFGHYEKDCRSTSPVCGKCAVKKCFKLCALQFILNLLLYNHISIHSSFLYQRNRDILNISSILKITEKILGGLEVNEHCC
nr:unnamed protein product [Callosobruchus chinensis]